jgi:dephospho-CoA kinase
MFAGRPIIGLAGGIGSGKSYAARLLREMGCAVIDSDAQVRSAYEDTAVRQQLHVWWGDDVFTPDGKVNRKAIARRVFSSPEERERLERLIHPLVASARDREMRLAAEEEGVLAFVWDTPLLFEAGLNRECDAVVFIDVDLGERVRRVTESRGWSEEELLRREKFQLPLDKKRDISDYVIKNVADHEEFRAKIGETLSQILANHQIKRTSGTGRV